MRKVLTYKESQGSSLPVKKVTAIEPETKEPLPSVLKPAVKAPVSRFEYHFLHPDVDMNLSLKGKYFVDTKEGREQIPIVGGRLITKNEEAKNILLAQGFILMFRKDL